MNKEKRYYKKEDLKAVIPEIYSFMESHPLEYLQCGTYQLPRGIFLNVESYETRSENPNGFEAHRRYIDFQYMINGREIISVCDKEILYSVGPYDCNRDIEFYQSTGGQNCILIQGEGLLLYPKHAHMPCLEFENQRMQVKKAVFKIPISYFLDIKVLVFDIDGTLTDGRIYMGNHGEMMKAFDVKDGYGICQVLPDIGIIPIVITSRNSDIVKRRCAELGIKYLFQNVDDKWSKLKVLLYELNLSISNVVYMGDDLNDMVCMDTIIKGGGMTACPQNAVSAVKRIADYVCSNNSGYGAARELIDFLAL